MDGANLAIGLAALTALATTAGGILAIRSRDHLHLILGLSAGLLLGLVAFDLLPEVFELNENTFGNVLGSNGSVVPLFADQIRKGGPVTVTHPEIKRFFMTIPEAVQLVLQASRLGGGGEVFVLDMGEQVKVVDLARNMIVLSGLVPDQDIQIVYSGLRPGEKLYEELFDDAEQILPTSHIKIRRAISPPEMQSDRLDQAIAALETAVSHGDDDELIRRLQEAVPTYIRTSSCSIEGLH